MAQKNMQESAELLEHRKEKLELLKWNYERCQEDYHSKDQMTHDTISTMSQVLVIYAGAITLPFLARISSPSIIIPYIILILFSGAFYLFFLLMSLENLASCKIELRNQCISIENKIKDDYTTNMTDVFFTSGKYKMVWECIVNRKTIPFIKYSEKKRLRVSAAFVLLIFWISIMSYMLYIIFKSYLPV